MPDRTDSPKGELFVQQARQQAIDTRSYCAILEREIIRLYAVSEIAATQNGHENAQDGHSDKRETPKLIKELRDESEFLHRVTQASPKRNLYARAAEALETLERELNAERSAAATVNEQAPCAWRYRYGKTGSWKYVDSANECNPSPEYERQPIYQFPWHQSATGTTVEHWRDIAVTVPPEGEDVLGFYDHGECAIIRRRFGGGYVLRNGTKDIMPPQRLKLTHWMPIPSAPTDSRPDK